MVSRETDPAPTPYRVRTAGDLAATDVGLADDSTPLAEPPSTRSWPGSVPGCGRAVPRPDRTRVMVVANQKGGVGKTTTHGEHRRGALAQLGQRVLVVDLDPQGNASTALGVEHRRGVASTYDAVVDGVPLADVTAECPDLPGLWAVPATIDLAGAEIELVSVVARESRLHKAIAGHPRVGSAQDAGEERFDYVLIDCPPSLGLLTLNALVSARR